MWCSPYKDHHQPLGPTKPVTDHVICAWLNQAVKKLLCVWYVFLSVFVVMNGETQ